MWPLHWFVLVQMIFYNKTWPMLLVAQLKNTNITVILFVLLFFAFDVPQADRAQTERTLWLQAELVQHWCNPQGLHQQDNGHIRYRNPGKYFYYNLTLNGKTIQDGVVAMTDRDAMQTRLPFFSRLCPETLEGWRLFWLPVSEWSQPQVNSALLRSAQ